MATPKERLERAAEKLESAASDVVDDVYEGKSEAGKESLVKHLGVVKQAVSEIEEIIR